MPLFGRQPPVPRRQHPDPAIERELERIRQLQRRHQVKEDQINDYRVEIDELHKQLRRYGHRLSAGHGSPVDNNRAIEIADQRVISLQGEIRSLEADIDRIHDEIGRRQDQLNSDDLAYL